MGGGQRRDAVGACDLQSCHGIPVWVGGCVVGNGLSDSRSVHVYREERRAEAGILCVHVVHQIHRANKGWHIDLIKIQAPNAVVVSLDTGKGVNAKFRLSLDVFPGYHRDVLLKGANVDDGLDERHSLF